jgi:hypothetical protein
MYPIDMHTMSRAFYPIWRAAGEHLSAQLDGGIRSWLRGHPYPPFLEHLSFRLGNQLFFILVEDADGQVMGPGNPGGVLTAARPRSATPGARRSQDGDCSTRTLISPSTPSRSSPTNRSR